MNSFRSHCHNYYDIDNWIKWNADYYVLAILILNIEIGNPISEANHEINWKLNKYFIEQFHSVQNSFFEWLCVRNKNLELLINNCKYYQSYESICFLNVKHTNCQEWASSKNINNVVKPLG